MRPNPKLWWTAGILLVLTVIVIWRTNETLRRGENAATGPHSAELSTKAPSANSGGQQPGMVATEATASTNAADASSVSQSATNVLAYRVSNTKRPLNELLRDNSALILRHALIDTANPEAPKIPEHLRAKSDPGTYIVQARGAITTMFRDDVLSAGADLVSYIPNNAMLVAATPAQIRKVQTSAYVQAVVPFEPYYKLDNKLLPIAVNGEASPYENLNVTVTPKGGEKAREKIRNMGGKILGEPERTPIGPNFSVQVPSRRLADLAQIGEVQVIGVRSERQLMNDLTRVRVRVSTNTHKSPAQGSHYLGLGGSNVVVAITDSGVDSSHEDFQGATGVRLFGLPVDLGSLLTGDEGHGTHVAGTLLGNGSQSGTVGSFDATNSFAQGSRKDANFSGMAPYATGYVHYYRSGTDIQLQEEATLAGALINNNSWAYSDNDYDIFAASYDAAVRDSLTGVIGEQQVTYVFAAGNSGGGNQGGFGGAAGSILSPGTGKNVISVGSSESLRHITNEVWKCGTNGCVTNTPWLPRTDSSNQVAGFSSRGNVGIGQEGDFGRVKPDVIAPGEFIVSCRASNYVHPSGTIYIRDTVYIMESLGPNATNPYTIAIPAECLWVDISTRPNDTTTDPDVLTNLVFNANMNSAPTGPPVGTNRIRLVPPQISAGNLYFTIWNPTTNDVDYDVVVSMAFTNDVGNYWEKLAELNEKIGPKYRYESGTSMSAPVVSGMLALMQEYYGKLFSATNSPALNKALLINGARSLSAQYNLDPRATVNHQGWGLVNLSNSAPIGLLSNNTTRALHFYDQNPTNALATGDAHVYTITVPQRAKGAPLRITLAWTDPAGNPVSGPKLVNDLDLFVDGPATFISDTNIFTVTNRWIGNNFGGASDFTTPIMLSDTNAATGSVSNIDMIVDSMSDNVNNVENVYIAPPLGDTYTVVVKARRVNVNAVNSHTNGIVQDYALVISSGTTVTTNTQVAVAGPVITNNYLPIVIPMQQNGKTNAIALFNQRVGANSPYLVDTNGMTNQWAFYTFTNMTTFTNVAIMTFLPPNVGFLRPNPSINPDEPRFHEGDIDLYVTRGASAGLLTNLDQALIEQSFRSTKRRGTEFVIFSNAVADEVFYIGVKAEDQQAATFGLFAVASEKPFSSRDEDGNIVVSAQGLPADIPDGSPDKPEGVRVIAIVQPDGLPSTVQRVYVTNTITHQNAGDLMGVLTHSDESGDQFATLNNHRYWSGTDTSVYDDSDQGDLEELGITVTASDGPGKLTSFVGQDAIGPWVLYESDNALTHTGSVDALTIVIQPASTNADEPVNIVRTIGGHGWLRAPFDVSADVTNANICVEYISSTPPTPANLDLFARRGRFPTLTAYDKARFDIDEQGGCMDLGLNDSPPLSPGRYFAAVYNDTPNPVKVRLVVRLSRGLETPPPLTFADNNPIGLLDDATTNAFIMVTNRGIVSGAEVDLRIDHPRASDLVLYLVNPQGTRVMLAENRGRTNDLGYGFALQKGALILTNLGSRVLDNGLEEAVGSTVYSAGDIVSGWLVGGEIDVQAIGGFGSTPHTGTNYMDLNGWVPGSISSNVVLRPGRDYMLSFAFARNPDTLTLYGGAVPEADVLVAGTNLLRIIADQLNVWTNLNWQTTSVVFRAGFATNLVQFVSDPATGGGGASGVLLDSIHLDEVEVRSNGLLYATFTENPAKLPVPIKFSPPPFGDTNFQGTNVFISGFEGTNGGVFTNTLVFTNRNTFTNGETYDGWLVTSNSVYVQVDSGRAYSDTNYLLLRQGTISRLLPTEVGKEYTISFAARAHGELFYNTGVDNDRMLLMPGETDPHYTTNRSAGANAYVLFTNAMGAAWGGRIPVLSQWIGVSASDSNMPPGAVTYRTTFDLREYDTNTVVIDVNIAGDDSVLDVLLNGGSTGKGAPGFGGLTAIQISNSDSNGFRQFGNTLDFVVTNGTTSPHGFRAELSLAAGVVRTDAVPRRHQARGRIRVGNYTNDFAGISDGWRIQTVTFIATSNLTTLTLEGLTHGLWLDHVQMRDTGRKYYLPEEPMAPLFGQQGFGPWTLEIWDSRLSQQLPSVGGLVSWRLNLSFVRTNPPFVVLTNGGIVTATSPSNAFSYFAVDVPCEEAIVDTLAVTLATGPCEVWFNQNTYPSGTGADDVFLGVANPDLYINNLAVGIFPLERAGRFFIGVRNVGTTTNTFNISADVSACPAASGASIAAARVVGGALVLSWGASASSEFRVLYSESPAGPWTEIATPISSTNGVFTFQDDGSATGGLPPQRFYKLKQIK